MPRFAAAFGATPTKPIRTSWRRPSQASGIETPTRAGLARLDRKRPKKGSNAEWCHPHDSNARSTKMKHGRTHLARRAEHAVDLEAGAIVGVSVQGGDQAGVTRIPRRSPPPPRISKRAAQRHGQPTNSHS
jgi:hypothetical protein